MKYVFIAALLAINFTSCNYSSSPIDAGYTIKIDTNLLGIWKAVEDTSSKNYILVQSDDDAHYYLDEILRDHGSVTAWNDALDKWIKENTGESNPFPRDTAKDISTLKDTERKNQQTKHYLHYITYFDNHGTNPHFQQWSCYLSRVETSLFLNIPYRHTPIDANGNFLNEGNEKGYLLARLIKVSPDTIITALVADPDLKKAKSSADVRSHVTKNLDNKNYYSDTMHFYRVKRGHFGLNESMKLANQ